MGSSSPPSIKLAEYLFTRLRQLGVDSIFGVPGDYNLRLLDYVEPSGLHWVGNCNELNAAYAADGYARVKGLGAVITTFGVGELSAINGIAGAYAERAALIHIVGTPPRDSQQSRRLVHHTFADGEYRRFAAAHANVTVAQASIEDLTMAPSQIDRVIEQALYHSRPVYLQVPDDMIDMKVSTANLTAIPTLRVPELAEGDHEEKILSEIVDRIHAAKQPVLLVDGEIRGLNVVSQINQLVEATKWPTWTAGFARGMVNENLDNVYSLYAAKYGTEAEKAYFESADLVLHFGPHLTNTNTFLFTTIPKPEATIAFPRNGVEYGGKLYRDVSTRRFLDKLLSKLDFSQTVKVQSPPPKSKSKPASASSTAAALPDSGAIVQQNFFPLISTMFQTGDMILTETGTAAYGGRLLSLPADCRFFTCVTWLSIGYMLPATLGAAVAYREVLSSSSSSSSSSSGAGSARRRHSGRATLFIGDGSFQMTAQEVSTIIREKLPVTIILLNNNGYTIERAIHGRTQGYNDIAKWKHEYVLGLFGQSEEQRQRNYTRVRNWGELRTAMDKVRVGEDKEDDGEVKLVEVFMDQEDCIGALRDLMDRQIKEAALTKGA
ncbi:pyruvate decarboxylase [Microdochium trichocladiopsis]|uniref:Pyruvate decarboxylase n=1 Tax=Microdochium trichocladiopsis TaxID=1682393 RepID=A0A9P9BQ30_9PEZI|nr:pyruvate decarboxylase [Microdochium trichocladiopsis]KAH7029785.1 pyruvate decarboxylase [Microdochium trichocladiopsis]